jgi:DNA-binding NtrC family response regulator
MTDAPERPAADAAASAAGQRPVVLLVDDDELVRAVTARMLQHLGADVRTATDAAETLAALGETGNGVRLVLLDLHLEADDGRDVLRMIVEHRVPTRVVLASGWGDGPEAAGARALGAVGFMQKPFSLESLRMLLREHGLLPGD